MYIAVLLLMGAYVSPRIYRSIRMFLRFRSIFGTWNTVRWMMMMSSMPSVCIVDSRSSPAEFIVTLIVDGEACKIALSRVADDRRVLSACSTVDGKDVTMAVRPFYNFAVQEFCARHIDESTSVSVTFNGGDDVNYVSYIS